MILNLCTNDYANFMKDITDAMRSVGTHVVAFKISLHEFGYEDEIPLASRNEIQKAIRKADVIQIFHSDLTLYNLARSTNPRARLIMYHTGTLYRQNPEKYNNSIDRRTKIVHALGEFMTMGARDPMYIVGAINTNKILPRQEALQAGKKLRIFGHFPSSKINKGTALIARLMESHMDINYMTSGTLLPHKDHLERLQEVDVLIELFSPSQLGKKYGSWGITTLEAAAMAKVVVTQNLSDQVYQDHYGDHPLQLANNPHEFHEIMNNLRDMTDQELHDLQIKTWKWVHNNHSHLATGRYINDKIINS